MFKNKPILNFKEYVYSLTDEERLKLMEFCSNFGNASQVLTSLVDTPPCCANKEIEVRINENYLLWSAQEKYSSIRNFSIKRIDSISYCYHSYGDSKKNSIVGLIFNDGSRLELKRFDRESSVAVFRTLQRYVHGFENIKPYDLQDIENIVKLPAYNIDAYYCFKGNAMYYCVYSFLSKKFKEKIVVSDIQDIIWCEQHYSFDSEASDSFCLDIYLNESKRIKWIYCSSDYETFKLAMELKKRIPHLLYGPSKEFEEIYRRNPAELMALAKSRMMNK